MTRRPYVRTSRAATARGIRPGVRVHVAALAVALLAVGCSSQAAGSTSVPTPSVSASASPTSTTGPPPTPVAPPKLGHYPLSGASSKTCVNGWNRPAPRTPSYNAALAVIRRETGVRGPLVVADMRYFTGPESPPSPGKGYLLTIRRWYVRLYARRTPAFQGRFLVEAMPFGSGLVAVAPYDSHGFRSPDWSGFQWDSGHPAPRPYSGLPGTWSGNRYDFVTGGLGLEFPGLPAAVVGCLRGS